MGLLPAPSPLPAVCRTSGAKGCSRVPLPRGLAGAGAPSPASRRALRCAMHHVKGGETEAVTSPRMLLPGDPSARMTVVGWQLLVEPASWTSCLRVCPQRLFSETPLGISGTDTGPEVSSVRVGAHLIRFLQRGLFEVNPYLEPFACRASTVIFFLCLQSLWARPSLLCPFNPRSVVINTIIGYIALIIKATAFFFFLTLSQHLIWSSEQPCYTDVIVICIL